MGTEIYKRRYREDRRILKRYLSQFYRAKKRQSELRQRLAELQTEFRYPHTNHKPSATAIGIGEIEEQIQRQIDIEVKCVVDIIGILELLPNGSTERRLLEYRHIDCLPWRKIEDRIHLSRSPCFEYYNKGLDALLAVEKVRNTLSDFKETLGND